MIKDADILSYDEFSLIRDEKQKEILNIKKNRRVHLGEYITVYFENYETMWWQIHEMLRIERGGPDQLKDELQAYGPLIPKHNELIGTVMIEIDDPIRRLNQLYLLQDIENSLKFTFCGHEITGHSLEQENRTAEDGKTSAIHFLRWTFTNSQISDFKANGDKVVLAICHPHYQAQSFLALSVHKSLSETLTVN